ncbi:c-type cytochrome biogenesis protein CcsB [Actinomadura sp. NBRC 104412]|uniref:c-type cytochrome biogenesis protein CcsB n=1 Tax=Actinomadura sp. NBRC 104412 TaxID=3032203 RepID=UPI0024A400CA|nr:c-type cytochrome biogenesis protein CcsB [Actinomadura sp. NBRC 104412]GLZ06417.1 c-type cytochrome biogenesis protein CcsB [Actinomadura sp. NBRC 104412]
MGTADLANLSDKLMLTTVVLYIVAMASYAADLGFGRRRTKAEADAVSQVAEEKAKVLVGAGTSGTDAPAAAVKADDEAAGSDSGSGGLERAQVDWARLAVVLNVLGWAAHLGAIVSRGLAAERWPWGNMYEFLTAIAFAAVTAFLVVLWRFQARFLGAFVTLAAVVALGIANIWLYNSVGPLVPALNSYWIAIHVTAAIIATGAFTVGGATTILYLLKVRQEVRATAGGGTFLDRLPGADALDRLSLRVTMFAFPIWTAAIIMGAVWADDAWGRYWGWDPKEIWSFVTWVAYAAYLHARATAGWKGRRAAVLSLIAFAALLFNFFGVNYMFSGLHSYA